MRLRPGLVVREESFGGLVFDVHKMGMWVVNESAAVTLSLCRNGESREAIARAVEEVYGCEQARADADAFLLFMVKEGFVLEE